MDRACNTFMHYKKIPQNRNHLFLCVRLITCHKQSVPKTFYCAKQTILNAIGELVPLIPKPTDFSFPSGHTACSFAAGFLLFRKLPKKYGIPVLLLAVLISFSRLYVGVHYPSDVIAGTVSGICISYLAEIAVNFLEKCVAEHHKKQQIERGKEA